MTKRRWLTSLPLCGVVALGAGCQDPEGGRGPDVPDLPDPIRTNPQALVADKLDLLLVVDNSISMADKQAILAPSIERLITDLVNPLRVDEDGAALPEDEQPAAGGDACPAGSARVHAPVTDLHVGIISSSLGALTTDACSSPSLLSPDDQAHLVSRGPGLDGSPVPTYQDQGFLAWDPLGSLSPAGESDLPTFLGHAQDMVVGVGELGCGFEMPLEATYRFLSDPEPYQSLTSDGSFLVKNGVDDVLLAQRAAFVRPDSLVAVVLLSDENDCSIDMSGQGFLALGPEPFYRGTSVCESDPNDVCCTSCGLPTPAGCAPDPACENPKYGSESANLKCWDQKRRYGIDFMNPVARYSNALSLAVIDPARPDLAPVDGTSGVVNPLFAGGRPAEFVTFTSIVGVPWQDLVSDPTNPASALKSTSQMEADGTWDWLVGPSPQDPFMRETIEARSGTNPATGEPVGSANGINGGDRQIPDDSLQYTCIFQLEQPLSPGPDCDNFEPSPLCDGTTQIAAKAFPGVRQLELVRALGDRGIAGSVCPGQVGGDAFDPGTVAARAYGYNQSVDALEASVQTYLADE